MYLYSVDRSGCLLKQEFKTLKGNEWNGQGREMEDVLFSDQGH